MKLGAMALRPGERCKLQGGAAPSRDAACPCAGKKTPRCTTRREFVDMASCADGLRPRDVTCAHGRHRAAVAPGSLAPPRPPAAAPTTGRGRSMAAQRSGAAPALRATAPGSSDLARARAAQLRDLPPPATHRPRDGADADPRSGPRKRPRMDPKRPRIGILDRPRIVSKPKRPHGDPEPPSRPNRTTDRTLSNPE